MAEPQPGHPPDDGQPQPRARFSPEDRGCLGGCLGLLVALVVALGTGGLAGLMIEGLHVHTAVTVVWLVAGTAIGALLGWAGARKTTPPPKPDPGGHPPAG